LSTAVGIIREIVIATIMGQEMLNDTTKPVGYDRVAQGFHWLTAGLMLLLIMPVGIYAVWLGDGPTRSYLLDHWHKPFGLVVIVLTVLRLVWKWTHPAVPEAPGLHLWERVASRLAHWSLYALLLAMPLSGLLMSEGAGRPTSVFGLFNLPQVLSLDPALKPRQQPAYLLGHTLHTQVFDWILYTVIVLHVAGAIKHQFIDNHRGYLRRMIGTRR